MLIKHHLYNAFIIESGDYKIAIDPGAMFMYWFRFTTLIPKSEWESITHIFVTHGDPDHYWHTDRVAKASGAPVICNSSMVREIDGKKLMLGPRDKGLKFTTPFEKLHTLDVNETIYVDGLSITGLKAVHGPLTMKVGPFAKSTDNPGPDERTGWGSMGFKIEINGKTIVNLADTFLCLEDWQSIKNPDVLMIPIGGKEATNTMCEEQALKAVEQMHPKNVIPCHYNMPALFTKNYGPADDVLFKKEAEKLGSHCHIMKSGDSIQV